MWIQIYVLKLNMHEKQDLFLLGCRLGSEPKLSSPMAWSLRFQKQVQFRLLMLIKCFECASAVRESFLVLLNLQ